MKQSTLIAIVAGVVIVCAAALVALNLQSLVPSGGPAPTSVPPTTKTTTDVLEKFDALKARVNASGLWFGGAATQLIKGDETAMVYLYRPVGSTEISDLLAGGYGELYKVFTTQDPLLVGLIDTTQKVSEQQFKVDVYAMERPMVELYAEGGITRSELVKKAIAVTPETESLRTSGTATVQPSRLPKPARNFTPPADRQAYLVEALNRTAYKPLSLQAGALPDGGKAVSMAISMPGGLSNAQKYGAIETGLRLCTEAFGDFDRYYLNLVSEEGNEYYVVDAGPDAVIDYLDGTITQDQLYRNINLTYYTK